MRAAKGHVRITPESGHVRCTSPCLLWAKSGHSAIYSTTSSARIRNGSEILSPRAFAVFRLTTS
jgi:hypothetical protein